MPRPPVQRHQVKKKKDYENLLPRPLVQRLRYQKGKKTRTFENLMPRPPELRYPPLVAAQKKNLRSQWPKYIYCTLSL